MKGLATLRLVLIFILTGSSYTAFSASYYSKGNLSVSLTSSWSSTSDGSGASPANFTGTNTWIIQNTDTMTLSGSSNWSLATSTVRIENGGMFTNATTGSIVDFGVFQIYGGGYYVHNSTTVPIPGSIKQFANSTNGGNGHGTVVVQTYLPTFAISGVHGNLTINYNNTGLWNQNASLTAVEGDFVFNTGSSVAFRLGSSSSTLTIGGNFYLMSGIFQASNGSPGTYVINLAGDFLQSGGTFNPNTGASNLAFNFTGVNKVFNKSAGTLTNTLINWKVNSGASVSLLSDLPIASSRSLTIDGALSCGVNKITGAGTVSVSSTGTLKLGSLSASGALGDNVTATLNTLAAGSSIEYSGAGVQYETNQSFQNLVISNVSGVSVLTGNTLQVKGDLVNNGIVIGSGKILLNRSSLAQNITGTGSIANLEIDNTNGVAVASGSTATITDALILTAGTLTTNDALTLQSSSANNTARVFPLGVSASVVGQITAERYIPARRGWRLLTAPVKGATNNSIFYNWQHNGGADDGTGVEIWGPGGTGESGNGLANVLSGSYSLRSYNAAANAWTSITNTQTEPLFSGTINKGFLTFVSGPYNSGNISSGATATKLTATGELITGEQNYLFNDALALVGNPYACPINFDNVWNNTGNVNLARQFWVVDPNLNDVGGYVLVMHNGTGYSVTPSGAGTTFQDQYIQNGQAFFVTGAAAGAVTMKINEDDKETATAQTAVFRTNGGNMETMRINLNAVPANSTPALIDGALINCHQNYSDKIAVGEDGLKFLNFNESISLIRNGSKYAIEGRPLLDQGDSIKIGLNGMRQRNYQLEIMPAAFNAPSLTATLIDNYLNTTAPVNLNGNTVYPFTVNAAAATGNDSRFTIVFNNASPLDVISILNLTGKKREGGVELLWEVDNEKSVQEYEVQRSADGRNFITLSLVSATRKGAYTFTDEEPFAGSNCYRIRAVSYRGKDFFSQVTKVNMQEVTFSMSVYPNPTKGNSVRVDINGIKDGSYRISLCNMTGQVLAAKQTIVEKGRAEISMDINNLSASVYMIHLMNAEGLTLLENKLIKE